MTAQTNVDGANVICLADVKPASQRWLWRDRIPFGAVTVVDGSPGAGKGSFTGNSQLHGAGAPLRPASERPAGKSQQAGEEPLPQSGCGIRVAGMNGGGASGADLLVGAGPNGGPAVSAFNLLNGAQVDSFFAFDPHFEELGLEQIAKLDRQFGDREDAATRRSTVDCRLSVDCRLWGVDCQLWTVDYVFVLFLFKR